MTMIFSQKLLSRNTFKTLTEVVTQGESEGFHNDHNIFFRSFIRLSVERFGVLDQSGLIFVLLANYFCYTDFEFEVFYTFIFKNVF